MLYDEIKLKIGESNKKRFYSHKEPGLSIISITNFLPQESEMRQRLLYIKYDIVSQVQCPNCKKPSTICRKSKGFKINYCSAKCNLIDNQTSNKKNRHEKMSKIDKQTGLTGYQLATKKSTDTQQKVDEDTGLTIYQQSTKKAIITLSKVDEKTGLTGYQKNTRKSAKTMMIFDNNINLTGYQKSIIKRNKSLSIINPISGLTKKEENNLKNLKNKKYKSFEKILKILKNDFCLISSLESFYKSDYLKYQCKKCDSIRESYWPYIRCTKCYPYNKSIAENEILKYCQSLSNNIISNNRQIINPLELDIYLPNNNLAIEYNGLFWHSSDSIETENKNYHLHKTQECEKQNIQLFHIFENEWLNPQKQVIWKSIIINKLGQSERVYARKTEVHLVSSKDKTIFLNDNHLQGNCMSSVNLGLFLDDELVSLMTFGKSRYKKDVDWELLRFCNKLNTSVVGGASKLLSAFRKENDGSIISYADKRRSNGNLYKKLGFEFSHESKPNYFYWKDNDLESRIKYQKHKLKDILTVFDSKLTESENMYNNKFRKIYDCGNQVWILN